MNHYIAVGIVLIVIVALMATNKKLVETLKNIYKIEELRKRILYTLGLLLVYRLGSFVVIPGINPNALGEGSALANQMSDNSLLGLLDVFSGGAFGNAAIFALGVMPYITASIIIQLMGIMIPYFQKMQKEAASRGEEVAIEARPMNEAMDHINEADVILLGPQIGYAKGDFEKAVEGRIPVAVIPMVDYGRMNAAKILDDVKKMLG